jgi:hypothetical protein
MLHLSSMTPSPFPAHAPVRLPRRLRRAALTALLLPLLLLCSGQRICAQDTSDVKPVRLAIVSGVTLGTVIPVHIYQQNAWWQGPRGPFRFENDWIYALNVDKLGHMYSGYILSRTFGYMLQWSGFSEHTSIFCGSVLGLSYELYVEFEDGFHRVYGFSPGDAFFDIIGATIPLAQGTFPVLRNFALKYSYWPSTGYRDELKAGQAKAFLDDYQGTTMWLTVDPHFMMGSRLADAVPSWLGLAFGVGARDLNESGGGRRQATIALDYNFSRIETRSDFLRVVFTLVDFIHLPAPGIRLDGKRVLFGIFYP